MDGTDFMSSRGLVHFDAHFTNIPTDGRRLYFADFGLALSSRFDLSTGESGFLSDHLAYDRCYTASHLLRYHAPDTVTGETALPHPLQDRSSITVRSTTGGGSCTRTRPNPPGEEGVPGPAGEPPAREQLRGFSASRGRRSGCR